MLVPDIDKLWPCVNIKEIHATYIHANNGVLEDTAAKVGMTLKGEFEACSGCSKAKGFRNVILLLIPIWSDTKLRRVLIGQSGPNPVPSLGEDKFDMTDP